MAKLEKTKKAVVVTKKVVDKSVTTLRSILRRYTVIAGLTLVGVALLQLALAGAYMVAFHAPKADDLPVLVTGKQSTAKAVAQQLEKTSDGAYKVAYEPSTNKALDQLKSQQAYAIYRPNLPQSTITVASANSATLADSLTESLMSFDASYQKQSRQQLAKDADPTSQQLAHAPVKSATVKDVAELRSDDPNGLGMFYLAFSFVFGGYLAAVALNLVKGKPQFSHQLAWIRSGGLLVFSAVTSLSVTAIATHAVNIVPADSFWLVAMVGCLTTLGVGLFSSSLISLMGVAGTALVILLFVVLGTPASGGPMAVELTGTGPWQLLAPYLPTGASLGMIRQYIYFDGVDVLRHLWPLIGYVAVGLGVLLVYGQRSSSIGPLSQDMVNRTSSK